MKLKSVLDFFRRLWYGEKEDVVYVAETLTPKEHLIESMVALKALLPLKITHEARYKTGLFQQADLRELMHLTEKTFTQFSQRKHISPRMLYFTAKEVTLLEYFTVDHTYKYYFDPNDLLLSSIDKWFRILDVIDNQNNRDELLESFEPLFLEWARVYTVALNLTKDN